MNKKGNPQAFVTIFLAGLAILAVVYFVVPMFQEPGTITKVGEQVVVPTSCPDDGDTNLKIDMANSANSTGYEVFDNKGYLYKLTDGKEEYVAAVSDGTSPTATTIDCGQRYVWKPVSSSGANGGTSRVAKVISGDKDVKIENGLLYFTADTSNENIKVGLDQHATLECRAYDNQQNGFVYDNAENSATDYDTDGVTWMSTTNNETKMDETIGLDLEFQCRAVEADANYNDRGLLLLIEAPTGTWEEPVVKYNGQRLSDIKGTGLNADEIKAYAGYEYVFFVPSSVDIYDAAEGIDFEFKMQLLSGVSTASADPEFDIAPRGGVLSIDGVNVLEGTSVKDDSSQTVVHVLFDMTVDVT